MSWQPVLCRNPRLCSVCGILLNKQEPAVCSSFCSIWSQYVAPRCSGPEVTGGRARSPSRGETRFRPELLPQRHAAGSGGASRVDSFPKCLSEWRPELCHLSWPLRGLSPLGQSRHNPASPSSALRWVRVAPGCPKQEHFCIFRSSHSS